jgi:protein SCO1/2
MAVSAAQKRNVRYTAFALAGVIALMLSLFVRQFINPSQLDAGWLRTRNAVIFEAPRQFQAPRLIDQEGRPFDGSTFQGKWSVVFFGFTHCPDVCPTTLSLLRQVQDALKPAQGQRLPVAFYLSSVDPARDTPAQLKPYVAHFSPSFTGLTGEFLDVHRFSTDLNTPFRKSLLPDGDYTVDHGSNLALIDPRGQFAGFVTPPFDVAKLTELLEVMRSRP